jgi:hypothetical protein
MAADQLVGPAVSFQLLASHLSGALRCIGNGVCHAGKAGSAFAQDLFSC